MWEGDIGTGLKVRRSQSCKILGTHSRKMEEKKHAEGGRAGRRSEHSQDKVRDYHAWHANYFETFCWKKCSNIKKSRDLSNEPPSIHHPDSTVTRSLMLSSCMPFFFWLKHVQPQTSWHFIPKYIKMPPFKSKCLLTCLHNFLHLIVTIPLS